MSNNARHAGPTRRDSIRVAVWSPYEPLARALRDLLESSGEAEAVELAEKRPLPQAVRQSAADVLVLDVDGLAAGPLIAEVLQSAPGVRIIALSNHTDRRLVAHPMNSGAAGYLLKDRAFEELMDAVRSLARNQRYVSPAVDDGYQARPP